MPDYILGLLWCFRHANLIHIYRFFRAIIVFLILRIGEVDLLKVQLFLTLDKRVHHFLVFELFLFLRAEVFVSTEIVYQVFRLVKILDHINHLAHDDPGLLNILLDKATHLRAEVLFHLVDCGASQLQRLHMIDTLDCESPSRERRKVNPSLHVVLIVVAFLQILDENRMIDHGIFKAAVLKHFFLLRRSKILLNLVDVIRINNSEYLAVIPWLDEGSYTTGSDSEGRYFVADLVEVLPGLVVSGVEGLADVGEHPFVAQALEEGVTLKRLPIYVDTYSDA